MSRKKGQFRKGHKPWNKGKKTGPNAFNRFVSDAMKRAAKAYRTKQELKKAVSQIKRKSRKKKR